MYNMSRHYSSSKLFNWIRTRVFKVEKPYSMAWGGWAIWEDDFKKARPIAHFFTEALPDILEWIPAHSIDYVNTVRYYVSNRLDSSHLLNSTLEKGKYHEFSERMIYSLFDSFVEFIEVEEANSHLAWSKEEDIKKYKVPFWARYHLLSWGKTWRCPAAGIDHLRWEMSLDVPDPNDPNWQSSPGQARTAREKMALYTWWKHIRPTRGSSWDASGFQAFWDEMDAKYGIDGEWIGLGSKKKKMSAQENQKYSTLSKASDDLEESWSLEDDEMLIRLVKLRQSLWT